jgi:hypothetical protein
MQQPQITSANPFQVVTQPHPHRVFGISSVEELIQQGVFNLPPNFTDEETQRFLDLVREKFPTGTAVLCTLQDVHQYSNTQEALDWYTKCFKHSRSFMLSPDGAAQFLANEREKLVGLTWTRISGEANIQSPILDTIATAKGGYVTHTMQRMIKSNLSEEDRVVLPLHVEFYLDYVQLMCENAASPAILQRRIRTAWRISFAEVIEEYQARDLQRPPNNLPTVDALNNFIGDQRLEERVRMESCTTFHLPTWLSMAKRHLALFQSRKIWADYYRSLESRIRCVQEMVKSRKKAKQSLMFKCAGYMRQFCECCCDNAVHNSSRKYCVDTGRQQFENECEGFPLFTALHHRLNNHCNYLTPNLVEGIEMCYAPRHTEKFCDDYEVLVRCALEELRLIPCCDYSFTNECLLQAMLLHIKRLRPHIAKLQQIAAAARKAPAAVAAPDWRQRQERWSVNREKRLQKLTYRLRKEYHQRVWTSEEEQAASWAAVQKAHAEYVGSRSQPTDQGEPEDDRQPDQSIMDKLNAW